MRTVEFWFEFASSYTYPAAMRIEALAKNAGVKIAWRPFLLGPIFQAQFGTPDSPFNRSPARLQYMWRDLQRHCEQYGLQLRMPSKFPRGSLLGSRVALIAQDEPWIGDFVRAMFHANYAEDRDIGSESVVGEILQMLGQPAQSWIERATSAENKARLKAQNEEAVARGIFGAPAMFSEGEMFWGNDRVEQALAWPNPQRIFFGTAREDAKSFAERWLPAWSGNNPELLTSFYADDALYLDPAVPQGLQGRDAIRAYFTKLLARNPDWVWTQREAIPMENGFVNLWHASVPQAEGTRQIDGVCLVVLRDGLIVRNEVYFDRSALL